MIEKDRVLIVDDERQNIKVLTGILRDEFKIMAAKDGESGLRAIEWPNFPDLILLDILLPGIDGYEVCQKLKQDEKTKNIPIIFVTAISEAMDAARAFEIGAVDYITKPFNPVTVKARVRTHIKHHKTLQELKDALKRVKTLSGLLPICANCKKIRDDTGYWAQVEEYISKHSEAEFSHAICPECMKVLYPELNKKR